MDYEQIIQALKRIVDIKVKESRSDAVVIDCCSFRYFLIGEMSGLREAIYIVEKMHKKERETGIEPVDRDS